MPQANSIWFAIRPHEVISAYAPGYPATFTTSVEHGLSTGDAVTIANVDPSVNGSQKVTVTSPTTFTISATGSGTYSSGGTATPTSLTTDFTEIAIQQPTSQSTSLCDLNGDGVVNTTDVSLAASMAIGAASCQANLAVNGGCTVVTVQKVVDASLGGACQIGK